MNIQKKLAKLSLNVDKRLQFYEKLQAYAIDNISPYDAVSSMHKRYEESKNTLKDFTSDVLKKMNAGQPLSSSLSGWVPDNDIILIRSGEQTDNVAGALKEAINLTKSTRQLKSEVLSNVLPSVIYIFVLFSVIYGFSVGVIPDLKSGFDPDKISDMAKSYFGFTSWIVNNALLIFGFIIAFVIISVWSLSNLTLNFRYKFLDKIPPWSVYKRIQSGYFLINLSAMLRAGVSPIKSLEDMNNLSSPYLKKFLKKMIIGISSGKKEGDALDVGFIPKEMMNDVIDYGRLSSFSLGIQRVGERSVEETSKFLKVFSQMFKMMVLAGFGAFLLFTMGSILSLVDLNGMSGM